MTGPVDGTLNVWSLHSETLSPLSLKISSHDLAEICGVGNWVTAKANLWQRDKILVEICRKPRCIQLGDRIMSPELWHRFRNLVGNHIRHGIEDNFLEYS